MAPRSESLYHRNTTRPASADTSKSWAKHDTAAILGPNTSTREVELPKTHDEGVEAHAKAVEAEFKKDDKPAGTGPRFLGVEMKHAYGRKIEVKSAKQTSAFTGDLSKLLEFEKKVPFGYALLREHLADRRGPEGGPQRAEEDVAKANAPATKNQ